MRQRQDRSSTSTEVSVVVPLHNEKACVAELHRRVRRTLEGQEDYELILVDDGSTDGTRDLIRACVESDPNTVGVLLARNRGQSAAIYAGMRYSSGRFVVIMDGDLQNLPEEIPVLLTTIREGYSFVSGARKERRESLLLRRIPSRIANYLIRRTTGCPVRDMGGFGCIAGEVGRSLVIRSGHHRLLPAIVHVHGGKVAEVPVTAAPRFAGRSHYGIGRSVDVLLDILMLWFQTSNKQRPLYLFGRFGLLFLVLASGLFGWTLFERLVHGIDMGTRPPFLISILLFISSFGSFSLGFVLELLGATLESVSGAKPYVVQQILKGGGRGRAAS